jgi:tetratricopeptide (TPR) repeat protein
MPRTRRSVIVALGVSAVTVVALGVAAPARAQTLEFAAAERSSAAALAEHAIDCFIRGEDAPTRTAQLAAYREGLDLAHRAVSADDASADAHFALFANGGRLTLLESEHPSPVELLRVNRELNRALELNPNHAEALAARGGLYRELPWYLGGSLSKAETYLTRAIALDPDMVGARIELARTYRDSGHPERGIPLLETAASVAERRGRARKAEEARNLLRELRGR